MTREAELHNIVSSTMAGAFIEGYEKGITETNSKWKQAIQKTLKELKCNVKKLNRAFSWDEMKKDVLKEIDTTFKKNFGGLAG